MTELHLTEHARARMQQRAIPRQSDALLLRLRHGAGHGREDRFFWGVDGGADNF